LIDTTVKRILSEAHAKVREILGSHRQALQELARLLLEKEVVERAELHRKGATRAEPVICVRG
jgi:cell division protease FtsH